MSYIYYMNRTVGGLGAQFKNLVKIYSNSAYFCNSVATISRFYSNMHRFYA